LEALFCYNKTVKKSLKVIWIVGSIIAVVWYVFLVSNFVIDFEQNAEYGIAFTNKLVPFVIYLVFLGIFKWVARIILK